jgi:predicted transcriptional regulator
MNGLHDSIECLYDASQRLRILDTLDNAALDLRGLMTALDSPRTTLQRNLSVLEDQGWIENTDAGYTVTTAGMLIREEVATMNKTVETINNMAPFLEAMNAPLTLDIDKLRDARLTVPDSVQPNAPMKRLLDAFEGADRVRGCLPVVSWVLVERSRRAADDVISGHEYVISREAIEALHQQFPANNKERSERNQSADIDLYVYEEDLPYGLFVARDRLALAVYNEKGRIQALIDAANETTIAWGEQVYERYKQQSKQFHNTDMTDMIPSVGRTD